MRNFRKRVGRFVYLKSKANELERRQYFQERALSYRAKFNCSFHDIYLRNCLNTELELEHGS